MEYNLFGIEWLLLDGIFSISRLLTVSTFFDAVNRTFFDTPN